MKKLLVLAVAGLTNLGMTVKARDDKKKKVEKRLQRKPGDHHS